MGKRFLSLPALFVGLSLTFGAAASAATYNIDIHTPAGVGNPTDATIANSGYFRAQTGGAGSGVYTRMFAIDTNSTTQRGYNCDAGNPLPFDQKSGVGSPYHLNLGDVPVVTYSGSPYLEFLYDPGARVQNYQITDMRIYIQTDTSGAADTMTPIKVTTEADLGNLGTLVWSLGGDVLNILDSNTGSGSGDMSINIPYSYFAGRSQYDNVYFWVKIENYTGGGYNEFAINKNTSTTFANYTPEPATVWGGLSASALLIGGFVRRRFFKKAA